MWTLLTRAFKIFTANFTKSFYRKYFSIKKKKKKNITTVKFRNIQQYTKHTPENTHLHIMENYFYSKTIL